MLLTRARRRHAVPAALVAATAALVTACSAAGSAPHVAADTSSAGPATGSPSTSRTAALPAGSPAASSAGPSAPASPGQVSSGQASSGQASSGSSAPSGGASSAGATTAVHIKLINDDGATYGVGMPVIALLSHRITSLAALQAATTATVDGRPIAVAWYAETSGYEAGYPMEAHLRPQSYWPAHARIHVDIAAKGRPAGAGLVYDDSLTSDWSTGARNVATVDDRTHTISITSDGTHYGTFPVSLGASDTATYRGTKVIMEKVPTVCMHDTENTYHECGIQWDQRVTYTGEYLHAAPWNCTSASYGCQGPHNNIGRADSSNGCTNLRPSDAKQLYDYLRVGDVVTYPNADGPLLPTWAGYGDWNVDWSTWLRGGAVST